MTAWQPRVHRVVRLTDPFDVEPSRCPSPVAGEAVTARTVGEEREPVVYLLFGLSPRPHQVAGSPGVTRHLQQIGPMTAGLEIQASTGLDHLPIGPWAGLGVLAAWAAAALLAGTLVLRLRDA